MNEHADLPPLAVVQRGRALFVLNTGDMVWWGKQAASPSENPYWTLVNEKVLKQLPPPDAEMRAAGLPGAPAWARADAISTAASSTYVYQAKRPDSQILTWRVMPDFS